MITTLICALAVTSQPITVSVEFSGGFETDRRDHGRPVVLIASALGVSPQVFRDAFSHVTPASGGRAPEPEQVHRNKDALLSALGKHGVTNERLDAVSDFYRYNPGRGEYWPWTKAKATAAIVNGKITSFKVIRGGSGYTSVPYVSVVGFANLKAAVTVSYSKEFSKNGSITAIKLLK